MCKYAVRQQPYTLSSSFTRLSVPSTSAVQLPENQRDIINKCTSIVQDFRLKTVKVNTAHNVLEQTMI